MDAARLAFRTQSFTEPAAIGSQFVKDQLRPTKEGKNEKTDNYNDNDGDGIDGNW